MAAAQPKPAKRLGGMAEALAIAADLGFPAPTTQVSHTTPHRASPICLYRRLVLPPAWFGSNPRASAGSSPFGPITFHCEAQNCRVQFAEAVGIWRGKFEMVVKMYVWR
jgi:hypothetical protein